MKTGSFIYSVGTDAWVWGLTQTSLQGIQGQFFARSSLL